MEDHTIKSIKSFRKDLKRHFLMAILFIVLHFVILLIGGLIFFYIEHCYDATPPVMDALTQNYFKFCQLMESVTLQDNQTLQEIGNTTNVTLIKNSLDTCKLDKLQFQGLTCKLNSKILFVWTDYVHTIAFTIGKYLKILIFSLISWKENTKIWFMEECSSHYRGETQSLSIS